MDRRTFVTTGFAGAVSVSGCLSLLPSGRAKTPLPAVPGGSWTQHGADSANTFAPDVAAPPRGNLAWTSEAFTRWEPVIADGTVYTTNFDPSTDGHAFALDAQDGSELWRTPLDGAGDHGRALVDERFIVAHGRELVALDPQDGEVVWRRSLDRLPTGRRSGYAPELLAADDGSGTVVVPYSGGLKAFRATDGEPRWDTARVTQPSLTPAIHDAVYAVGRVDGTDSLAAVALDDGTTRWTTALETPSTSADPVATDHGILVVEGDALGVYDRETGERRSEIPLFDLDTTLDTTVAADGGMAFVANHEGLVAVDLEAETTRWLHEDEVYAEGFAVGTETVVAMVDGSAYVPSDYAETITAFDRETGDARWNYVLDGFHALTIPPILVDGAVCFATSSTHALAVLGDVPAEG